MHLRLRVLATLAMFCSSIPIFAAGLPYQLLPKKSPAELNAITTTFRQSSQELSWMKDGVAIDPFSGFIIGGSLDAFVSDLSETKLVGLVSQFMSEHYQDFGLTQEGERALTYTYHSHLLEDPYWLAAGVLIETKQPITYPGNSFAYTWRGYIAFGTQDPSYPQHFAGSLDVTTFAVANVLPWANGAAPLPVRYPFDSTPNTALDYRNLAEQAVVGKKVTCRIDDGVGVFDQSATVTITAADLGSPTVEFYDGQIPSGLWMGYVENFPINAKPCGNYSLRLALKSGRVVQNPTK